MSEVVEHWLEKLVKANREWYGEINKLRYEKPSKPKKIIHAPLPEPKKTKLKQEPIPVRKTKKELEREELDEIYEHNKKAGFVYLMQSGNGYYKIGMSKNPRNRLDDLRRQFPVQIGVVHKIYCKDYRKVEGFLHRKYSSKRAENEWFTLDDEDVEWIKSLNNYELG